MGDFELSAAEFRALYERVKHMSRWGPADRRGACEELDRWSFLCIVAPLRLRAGTGSPINPIAIF
jgi:hypothetical protein